MKSYWDTSAIINAFISMEVLKRLDEGEHYTRLHSFAEFFCTLTGRGIPAIQSGHIVRISLSGNDCAAWLRKFAEKVQVIEPDKEEVLSALERAQIRGVQGGHVYDYLHACI